MDHLKTEDALRAVVESLPSFVMLLDREHRMLFINRLVGGFTMDQVIGASAYTFIPPEFHGVARQAYEEAWRTGKPTRYELKGAGGHGTLAWYASYVVPVIKGGDVVALTLVTEDITEQKRAEEARAATEARFRAAVDGSLDAFLVLTCERDASSKIIDFVADDVNTSGAAFVGLPREAVLGGRLSDFFPHARTDGVFDRYVRVVETQEVLAEDQRLTTKEGTTRWVSHRLAPLPDGVAISSKDITDTKQLEAELRDALLQQKRVAEELEQKNRQLYALSTPIIQAWEGVLVLPVIGALDNARAQQIMERLLTEIARTRARFAVLDLTGMDAVDASTVDHMLRVVRAASLLGSRCLVSGISPAVARTMVEVAAAQERFLTFGLLQDALRYALRSSGVLQGESA